MRPVLVRTIVLDVFARVMEQGELADHSLHRALRAHKELHSVERRYIATALFAMIRLHRRYDYLMEAGLLKAKARRFGTLATPELCRLRLAAALVTDLGELPEAALRMSDSDSTLAPALQAVVAGEAPWPSDPVARLCVEESLPGWFAKRLLTEYGGKAPLLAHALNARAPLTLRTNVLKTTREELQKALAAEGIESQPGKYSPWALVLDGHHNVFGLKSYKDGHFDIQDEGSQLVALATGAQPGERVMDACCGAGGKTLALAAMMQNKGPLRACDVDERRMKDLRPRAKLAGAFNLEPAVIPDGAPGDKAIKGWLKRADVVLIDAPCSGTGSWRRHPDARWRQKDTEIAGYAELQQKILRRYAACVKPGGRLVYATCSLFEEENGQVADAFLKETPEFKPEPIVGLAPGAVDAAGRLRMSPHLHGTDGFFAAMFRRAK
jgi:16S rRNA (cytosine967-C5)-methyltransferase